MVSSEPEHLPKVPPSDTIALQERLQYMNLNAGDKNVQLLAGTLKIAGPGQSGAAREPL